MDPKKSLTRAEMIRRIIAEFKLKQGTAKAKWVYNQIRGDNKASITRTYNNLVVKKGISNKRK